MDITEKITQEILSILKEKNVFIEDKTILVSSKDSSHGDYTTNIALIAAKQLKTSPIKLAEEIVSKLLLIESDFISSIVAIMPGFVNITVSQKYLISQSKRLI